MTLNFMQVCTLVVLLAFGCGFLVLWIIDSYSVNYWKNQNSTMSPIEPLTTTMSYEENVYEVNGVEAERKDGLTTTGKLSNQIFFYFKPFG